MECTTKAPTGVFLDYTLTVYNGRPVISNIRARLGQYVTIPLSDLWYDRLREEAVEACIADSMDVQEDLADERNFPPLSVGERKYVSDSIDKLKS